MTSNYQTFLKSNLIEFRQEVKSIIDEETRHRETLTRDKNFVKLYEMYDGLRDRLGTEVLDTVIDYPAKGMAAKDKFKEMAQALDNLKARKGEGHYETFKMTLDRNWNRSFLNEKFHRYIYNLNYAKAKKYSDKLSEWWLETLERLTDEVRNGEQCRLIMMCHDESFEDAKHRESKNENASLQLSAQMKEEYDTRNNLLDCVKVLKKI